MNPLHAAVVITTYNNPRSLGILLETLARQSTQNFSVFIADDGSTAETRDKIAAFASRFLEPITHVWQPDNGYQKAAINNEVFRRLIPESERYPVTICLDGDTFLHPEFVADHLARHRQASERGHARALMMGRRVDLGPEISAQIDEQNVVQFFKGFSWRLWRSALRGETQHVFRGVRVTAAWVRKPFRMDSVPDLLGSNFSISTELLAEVNGYNEDYKSYWGEDGDLFVRVRNTGALLIGAKSYAVQFHLFHRRLDPTPEHQLRYARLLDDSTYRACTNGIKKLPSRST